MRLAFAVFGLSLVPCISLADESVLSARKFADCDFIQTTENSKTTPVPYPATAGCETGGGGEKSCGITVVPTQSNYRIDTAQSTTTPWGCQKITGDNPCAFVRADNIIFNSDGTASRTFHTNSDRVLVWNTLSQVVVEKAYDDSSSEKLTMYTESKFAVAMAKSAAGARFKCTLANGDQDIYPVVIGKDLSNEIKWVSMSDTDPVFNILRYQLK